MIAWIKHQAALVGGVTFRDGKRGNVALVGGAENPKGVMVMPVAESGQSLNPQPLADFLDQLTPEQMVDILCAQERSFGKSGLEPLELGP